MFAFNNDNADADCITDTDSLSEAEEWWNSYPNWWNK